ncbi:MAG: DUF3612 domain-containing protein [Burkholderiales bacterium]
MGRRPAKSEPPPEIATARRSYAHAQIAESIGEECSRKGGQARIGRGAAEAIRAVANSLSIGWVEDALQKPARIICPRSSRCPRPGRCDMGSATSLRDIIDVKREILMKKN